MCMTTTFHGLPNFALGPPKKKKVVNHSTQNWALRSSFKLASKNTISAWYGPQCEHKSRSLNMVHFHYSPSLRARQLQNWNSSIPTLRPSLDDSQGLLNLQGSQPSI